MSAPNERWAQHPRHTCYEVSDRGRVISHLSEPPRLLKMQRTRLGHRTVQIKLATGRRRTSTVHRLVLETFVGPCPEGMECCHNNGVHGDNRLENLRWDTRASNALDAIVHGSIRRGERQGMAKLSEAEVIQIKAHRGWLSARCLARTFGVSSSTIDHIFAGMVWRHVV